MDIQFKKVSFQYSPEHPHILKDLLLKIKSGESVAVVGESGVGKSTLMKMVNGLLRPQKGEILLNKEPIDYTEIYQIRRKMGYVMQQSGLFPALSVEENITLMARVDGWKKADIKKRLKEVLDCVDLNTPVFRKRDPYHLSGGQRQRVAVARALFYDPPVLLLDEPFTYLDSLASEELLREFIKIKREFKKTMLLVTHDLRVAYRLADRICLLANGKIEQDSEVKRFISTPKSPLAKRFVQTIKK